MSNLNSRSCEPGRKQEIGLAPGKVDKLRLTIQRPKLSPEDIMKLEEMQRKNPASEYCLCNGRDVPLFIE